MQATRFEPGTGWSPPAILAVDAVLREVAGNAAGDVVAVWEDLSGTSAAQYTPGSGWGSPRRLATGGGVETADVAVAPDGRATAMWTETRTEGSATVSEVWATQLDPDAGWGEPILIDEHASGPVVAIDADGTSVVGWQRNDDEAWSVWTRTSAP